MGKERSQASPGMASVVASSESKARASEREREDTQALQDEREIALDWVGIDGFESPLCIGGWETEPGRTQSVVATLRMGVDLEPHRKGVHMSRLVEIITGRQTPVRPESLVDILHETCRGQDARQGEMEIAFSYFLERRAPVTQKSGLQAYRSWFQAQRLADETVRIQQSVEVPVMTLCPCSKAISDYGAHNQRAYVRVDLWHGPMAESDPLAIHLEEIVQIVEASASSPLYPILKRADERHVTMAAYDRPVFTEDVAREIVTRLKGESRCQGFKVDILNEESIHNHSVRAVVEQRT